MTRPFIDASCRLCAIAEGRHTAEYDLPVVSSEAYFGVASIGGFVPGWSLVCPREHVHNLGIEYRNPALHRATSMVVEAVAQTFGAPAVFEHGALQEGSPTACGTSHAHLHVVPFAGKLADTARLADPTLVWEPVSLQDFTNACNGCEYLFVANRYIGPETIGLLARLSRPRSQFFRKLLADLMHVPQLANYRDAPLEEISSATATRIRAATKSNSRHAA